MVQDGKLSCRTTVTPCVSLSGEFQRSGPLLWPCGSWQGRKEISPMAAVVVSVIKRLVVRHTPYFCLIKQLPCLGMCVVRKKEKGQDPDF